MYLTVGRNEIPLDGRSNTAHITTPVATHVFGAIADVVTTFRYGNTCHCRTIAETTDTVYANRNACLMGAPFAVIISPDILSPYIPLKSSIYFAGARRYHPYLSSKDTVSLLPGR